MVGIRDAHVRRRLRRDIRNHVAVNSAVIRIQLQLHLDIRIDFFEIRDRLLIDFGLCLVGIVFRPERYLVGTGFVKRLRHRKWCHFFRSVATAKDCGEKNQRQKERKAPYENASHPFVPPLATPSIILFRKTRNKTISGTEIATTAAFIAGILSRPKPFSRIS